MGLLAWLFPSPERRIEQAREALARNKYREARDLVDGLDSAAAAETRRAAENGMAELNLIAVLEWAEAGEDARVEQHLALAQSLQRGGMDDRFREVHRRVREIRAARREESERKRADAVRRASADPLGLTGRNLLHETQRETIVEEAEADRSARLALTLENYPTDLRDRALALGPEFARAILELEDGRPDLALQRLLELSDEPIVCFERARSCWALNDPAAAIKALRQFAQLAMGHRAVGPEHTGVMLAQLLAEQRDLEQSIRVLREVRAAGDAHGDSLLAQLLLATGSAHDPSRLVEAEALVRDLIVRHPNALQLFELLAQIRLAGGHRVAAMHALEQSLQGCCEVPGKCGSKQAEPTTQRLLATLYLEDGIETERAVELAGKALDAVEMPTWEDVYLHALAARAVGSDEAAELAEQVRRATPEDDPRHERLTRFLPRSA